MSAVERLAAAIGRIYPMSHDLLLAQIFRHDPDLAADIELGAAWRRAEAALPEGRWWIDLRQIADKTALVAYQASIRKIDYSHWPVEVAGGSTPTAALTALAERLEKK